MQSFDFTRLLPDRTNSSHTQRAYFRWVDRYLADIAGLKPTQGAERHARMVDFPIRSFQRHLTARKFRNWLERLVEEGQGRQGLDQARAAIVTLASLLAEHGFIEAGLGAEIQSVSVPPIQKKDTPERLLTPAEVKLIMSAAQDVATSPQQQIRNQVVSTMLCTMALRREELSLAKWADLKVVEGGRVVLKMAGDYVVDMPRPVLAIVDRWRTTVGNPAVQTALIRRIWKGGRIAKAGLSPDGIWLIIRNASVHAGLGFVTPDDLRRSAAANMYRKGMPIEELSRLLRHRSPLITERFIAKLPITDQNA